MSKPTNLPELVTWFMNKAGYPVTDSASYKAQLYRAKAIVGTKHKPGPYNIDQVMRGVRVWYQEFGDYPNTLSGLTYYVKDGEAYISYANTLPPLPSLLDPITLAAYLTEWGDMLTTETRKALHDAIRHNSSDGGRGLTQLGYSL